MGLIDYTLKLLGLSETIHKWYGSLRDMDDKKRDRAAQYCETIADTIARAGEAFERLKDDPSDTEARRDARREFGRITGYIEDIAAAFEDHLDGRKTAGVKRRLEALVERQRMNEAIAKADEARIQRLNEAEGYFRSIADRLRA